MTTAPIVENKVNIALSQADFILLTRFILDAGEPKHFKDAEVAQVEVIFSQMDAVALSIDPRYADGVPF